MLHWTIWGRKSAGVCCCLWTLYMKPRSFQIFVVQTDNYQGSYRTNAVSVFVDQPSYIASFLTFISSNTGCPRIRPIKLEVLQSGRRQTFWDVELMVYRFKIQNNIIRGRRVIGISGSLIWSKTLIKLISNPCGEFRWSPEGPVSQIHSPHLLVGAPGIFQIF